MAVELDASQYLLLEEISDVFKSFQNGLTNRWAIFLSNKTSYGKIVHCPSEILIAEKQEGEEAARKRWATQNVREKHLGDGKETAIDSTPEHFSILQIMTSHPVRQRAIQKRVRVGGLWRDGTKADDIQGGIEAEIAILLVIIFLQMMCVHVCACSGLSSSHCCECYRQCCVQCCRVTKLKYYFSWCDSCFQNRKK